MPSPTNAESAEKGANPKQTFFWFFLCCRGRLLPSSRPAFSLPSAISLDESRGPFFVAAIGGSWDLWSRLSWRGRVLL
jgi:hypothetical protein